MSFFPVPRISETERQALEAGTVWADGELFSGRPDFAELAAVPYPQLTDREREFLDGPVETVCGMIDPWDLHRERVFPEDVWSYLKAHGFFGLNIPEEYGGLGFSMLAQSTIYGKLASRSLGLSAIVLIPNSVGPGELLVAYGTPEQRDRYLPRLARGEEMPCFALTEPEAGSDAASLTSRGVVFPGEDGTPQIRLDFHKRYITLAPVATLLGLAVRLEDPADLLGRGEHPGITVVLVPTDLPGVEVGRRHDPMGVAFPNGPIRGKDVIVPASQILGGPDQAGRGWKMLMEALSGGRAVSLPAQSAGGAKKIARVASGYAAVREQFGRPIADFEGVGERLARIGGLTYLMEAARVVTCGAVDAGHRPAVISAIVKVQETELLREVLTDAMDVLAGAALCKGPSNPLGEAWPSAPIGITVEGANILSRTLIVFGQGALRCHPYLRRELAALEADRRGDLAKALAGHGLHFVRNVVRSGVLGVTRGRLARSPVPGPTARYYRRLSWASARFAQLADVALLSLGPAIKRKEALSGRFADALSWMYLGWTALRRFEAEGSRDEDLPFVRWAVEESLWRVQQAFEGIHRNFEGPGPIRLWMRTAGAFLTRLAPVGAPPSDRLGFDVARRLTTPGKARDRLTAGVLHSTDPTDAAGRLEHALRCRVDAEPALALLRRAMADGKIPRGAPEDVLPEAIGRGVLDKDQARRVRAAVAARREAIRVDEFSVEEYVGDPHPPRSPLSQRARGEEERKSPLPLGEGIQG